jgi:hypothetical protein
VISTIVGHVFGDVVGIAHLLTNTFLVVWQVLHACCPTHLVVWQVLHACCWHVQGSAVDITCLLLAHSR